MSESDNLLPRCEVERRTGFKRSALYERIANGTFPAPLRDPDTGTVRWLESDVETWKARWISRARAVGTVAGSRGERLKKRA